MWFTRTWIVLLVLAVATGLVLAFAVPRPIARELDASATRSLDYVQHNTELLLKLEARHWLDTVVLLARDNKVGESLRRSGEQGKDLPLLRSRLEARLKDLVSGLPADERPSLLIGVDLRGKQIARVGPGHDRVRLGVDGLVGYPVVGAALRGYIGDDTWSIDGKLFMVAAAPVITRRPTRYVGALLVGQEINSAFASRLRARLTAKNLHLAFFLRGHMVASTLSSPVLSRLPRRYTRVRSAVAKLGRSQAMNLGEGDSRHLVVMAPFPGEARHHDAFYAVVAEPPASVGGLTEVISRVGIGKDLSGFPWLLVGGIALLLVVIGIGLTVLETSRPLSRMLSEVRRLGRGETSRLEPRAYGGLLRQSVQAINDAVDRHARRPGSGGGSSGRDLNKIMGAPEPDATKPDLRLESSGEMPPLAGLQPLQAADGVDPATPNLPDYGSDFAGGMGAAATVEEPPQASMSADTPFVPAAAEVPLMSPVALPEAGAGDSALTPMPALAGADMSASQIPQAAGTPLPHSPAPLPAFDNAAPLGGDSPFPLPAGPFETQPDATLAGGGIPAGGAFEAPGPAPFDTAGGAAPFAAAPFATQGSPFEPSPFEPSSSPFEPSPSPFEPSPSPFEPSPSPFEPPASAFDGVGAAPQIVPPSAVAPAAGAGGGNPFAPPAPFGGAAPLPASSGDAVMSSVSQSFSPSGQEEGQDLDAYFRQIYNEFLLVKRQCGEATDNITFDRFAAKLQKNRANLVDRYGCKSVKFQVYVKDGKAALKATPVRA